MINFKLRHYKNKIREPYKKIVSNKSLLNGAFFSLFSFINKGFVFLLLLILANYIAPAEYGYLSLFVTVTMVIGYFMALSTEGYLGVAFFKDKKYGVKLTLSGVVMIATSMALLMFLCLYLLGDTICKVLQLPLPILFDAVGVCFFTLLFNLYIDYIRLQERALFYGFISCSNALLNFVVSILLVKTYLMGWQGRVYAQLGCFVLYGIVAIIFFTRKRLWVKPNWVSLKKIIIWGLPIIPHLAANFIRQGCDRYIISYNHSIADVGLFSFALNIANVVIMIGIGFNQSNSVDIYKVLGNTELSKDEKLKSLKSQRVLIQRVFFVLTLLIMIIGYFTLPLILPKYVGAMNYFLCLAIWGFFQCLYFLYTNYLFFYNKTRNIMYITFGTSLLHLTLSLLLTKYSLYYTCAIYVFVQILVFLLIRKAALKVIKNNL